MTDETVEEAPVLDAGAVHYQDKAKQQPQGKPSTDQAQNEAALVAERAAQAVTDDPLLSLPECPDPDAPTTALPAIETDVFVTSSDE